MTSSARAKTPAWSGTSSRLKLDSQRNHRDQFISITQLQIATPLIALESLWNEVQSYLAISGCGIKNPLCLFSLVTGPPRSICCRRHLGAVYCFEAPCRLGNRIFFENPSGGKILLYIGYVKNKTQDVVSI